MDKIKINLKPLSVNQAWRGRRFKTDKYKQYEKDLGWMLPKNIKVGLPPYTVYYEFGVSAQSDGDNNIKELQDILASTYNFKDSHILEWCVKKVIVPKGKEYLIFQINSII
jgi:hypothetical protein